MIERLLEAVHQPLVDRLQLLSGQEPLLWVASLPVREILPLQPVPERVATAPARARFSAALAGSSALLNDPFTGS